ncbi:unnamed protein product [Caenorhabditis angaria]|uniref:Serpentine Receptor, class I n=1 Tax=Caenorhabditis angaria TaxID=860376 RepID=A0A9P1ITF0_9PELO|nr:unnamed protein product [Caenorhabditis angaria]
MISFEVPSWLIWHYDIVGAISFIINIFAMFLIVTKSGKKNEFRFYLMYSQFSCIIFDLQMSCFMQLCPLFPIVAGFSNGIASKYLNISTHVLMCLVFLFVNMQIHSLTMCFIKKHQTLVRIGNTNDLGFWRTRVIYAVCICWPVFASGVFYMCELDKNEQWRQIKELYPSYLSGFQSLREFTIYDDRNYFTLFAMVQILFGYSAALFIIPPIAIHMINVLNQNKNQTSAILMKKHRAAVKGLIAQFSTCPLTLIPNVFAMLTVVTKFENSQQFIYYVIVVMTIHSMTNSIVIIFSYPDYRNYVLEILKLRKRVTPKISQTFFVNV